MSEQKTVIATTDGACPGNGQQHNRGAAAAILEYNGRRRAVARYIGPTTNQRAEVEAAILALESLNQPCTVILRSDSKYLIETMNGNFKRKSNLDLWTRLDQAVQTHTITFEWIKGHIGHPEQEAADKIARVTAKTGNVDPVILTEAVARLNDEYTPRLNSAVQAGLKHLASSCDGAHRRDGVGFNQFDASLGHALASKPTLSPRDVASGRRLLLHYRKQIDAFNPSITAIL